MNVQFCALLVCYVAVSSAQPSARLTSTELELPICPDGTIPPNKGANRDLPMWSTKDLPQAPYDCRISDKSVSDGSINDEEIDISKGKKVLGFRVCSQEEVDSDVAETPEALGKDLPMWKRSLTIFADGLQAERLPG